MENYPDLSSPVIVFVQLVYIFLCNEQAEKNRDLQFSDDVEWFEKQFFIKIQENFDLKTFFHTAWFSCLGL